ncbi:sterol desaturase family protein [Allofrancisella guangzhouensis]|uniref:Sterol desaturase n=1 Tax=Allofrancisella guangzhouensis TaxID=594679 RepID=A0A0A8E3U5_9GAMM|nr:sterol desaturase family protein [Allofrancisella guangzhouensis]AJC48658.1 sterol desaturase [Allofrancisella guangzhouensis]MBK2027496.1 sterol desaturase family protein [Allofrancisella guangzhouensis]MBK2044488.1 sterol desaturase family protein [Allofrancisella guangzhouensis]MBK2045418.1 sterol desaturase family protein [Allofrancisella guangzhouensis]
MNAESILRLSFFFGILLVMLLWEFASPKRKNNQVFNLKRKFNNLILVFLNTIILRIIFPTAAVGVAIWCQDYKIGLLYAFDIAMWLAVIVAFLALDFAIYLQHVLFHYLPVLWKLHRVHHADMEYDVTTGLRFHPIEIVLSMIIKFGVIIFIGAPVLAVIIFEIVLNATSMFNHGNVNLSPKIDKFLRYIVVTPDMHRVHHSVLSKETNSNFGFNFSIWDKIFQTYIKQPKSAHENMDIGVNEYRNPKQTQTLLGMLCMPFKRD